jgi:hypothetical protein
MKIIIPIILLLSSCYSARQCKERFCSKDTVNVEVIIHDTIKIEGDSVKFGLQIDSLNSLIQSLISEGKDTTVTLVDDSTTKVDVVYNPKTRKLNFTAKNKEYRYVYFNITKKIKVPTNCPKPTMSELFKQYWYVLLIAFLLGLFCFVWIRK